MVSPFDIPGRRVFLTYGRRTGERCCLPSGFEARYEMVMHDHLRRQGFEVVVFFSHLGGYFLDESSMRAVMPDVRPPQAASVAPPLRQGAKPSNAACSLKSPGGLSLRRQAGAPAGRVVGACGSNSPRLRFPDMADPRQMVQMVERIMRDEARRSAVVFADVHIHDTCSSSPLNTHFHAFVEREVGTLPSSNRNILVFNFPGDAPPCEELARRGWGFLLGSMGRQAGGGGVARLVPFGPPGLRETRNHLLTLRMKNRVSITWRDFSKSVEAAAAFLAESGLGIAALPEGRFDREAVRRWTGAGLRPSADETLAGLVGLGVVKDYVAKKRASIQALKARCAAEPVLNSSTVLELECIVPPRPPCWSSDMQLHLMIEGRPGTGKTTVANLLGELYKEAGLLSTGHTIKATRADLVGEYIGATAPKTRAAIQRALGGVLFIDEAYSLCGGGGNDFGVEAVTTLTEAMTDLKGQFMVVMAGYPGDMARLLEVNVGLKSRFDEILSLPDYSPEELESILRKAFNSRGICLSIELDGGLARLCVAIHGGRDEKFGNARHMEGIAAKTFDSMMVCHGEAAEPRHLPPEVQKLWKATTTSVGGVLEELDRMTGLESVKRTVRSCFNRLRVEKERSGPDVRLAPGHFLFLGNPGTGKTTVARLMARQFFALGLLPCGEVHGTTASALIRGYLGATEEATREFLAQGLGKVIFIDEAHQLADGGESSFGRRALQTLVPFASDHKDDCCIILAGYPEAIERLLDVDPGLSGRFTHRIVFDDYSPSEMTDIFLDLLEGKKDRDGCGLLLDSEIGRDAMEEAFAAIREAEGARFANARTVVNVFNACLHRQADRLAARVSIDGDSLRLLIVDDVEPLFRHCDL